LAGGGLYIIEDLESMDSAMTLLKWCGDQFPGNLTQLYVGKKYPQRPDDIIVWITKQ